MTIPLDEAQEQLCALVEAVESRHETVMITRDGREIAVLMATADLDSLHETILWLSQPDVRADVEVARADQREGRVAAAGELRAELGLPE
ncbi:type II toxin-antitoxin system Phd/YefM family antitoxin [Geodermatophilus sp. SYSU D00814]